MKTKFHHRLLVCVATMGLLLSQGAILDHHAEYLFDDHSHSSDDHSSDNCSIHWIGESIKIGLNFPVLLDSQVTLGSSSLFEYEWKDLALRYRTSATPRAPPFLNFSV